MGSSFLDKKNKIKNMKNGSGIKQLIDEAHEILGNPIMMFDTSYTFLICNDVITDDWVWNEIVALGTFRHETVDFFNQENFIKAFATSETVVILDSKRLKYVRANGKLFDKDNVQLGNISVVACEKPFEHGDMELIEMFCEILSLELQNSEFYQKIDRVYQESLINQIISGTVVENEIANNMLAELYGGLKTNLYLAAVDITQYDKTNTHLAYFRDLFRKIQNEFKCYIHLNNIVIIISTDNEILNLKKDLHELFRFFEKYNIYAGISSKFQDITELKKYFREAISTLNYGLGSKRTQNIYCYDDFRLEHFLCSVVENINEICSPVVSLMQNYDVENNEDFLDVLYIYLLHGMNVQAVCEKTGLTSEELAYKLKKMEDVFMIDWKNGDMLSNIFISIKFIK